MEHEAYGLTDVGQVRERNEDSILVAPDFGLYVVCDGCGQHQAGHVASRLACEVIYKAVRDHYEYLASYAANPTRRRRQRATKLIVAAINSASKRLYAAAQEDKAKAGMGTTVVLLAVLGDQAIAAHVGDSRMYLVRRGHIHLLTEDHTLANQYLKTGMMTRKQARASRQAQIITRALGPHERVQVDALHLELVPGDTLLLCSDGLSMYVSDKEIGQVCAKVPPSRVPEKLVATANRRGGCDNISAVVVCAEAGRSARGDEVVRKMQMLQHVPLFRHLSFQELLRVIDLGRVEAHRRGSRILSEGEASDRICVSLAGAVDVVKGQRRLTRLPAGSLFGEMGLIDDAPRSADIVAAEDARVLAIRRRDFFVLLRRERGLAVKILWGLCRLLNARLRTTSEKLSLAAVVSAASAGADDLARLAKRSRPFL